MILSINHAKSYSYLRGITWVSGGACLVISACVMTVAKSYCSTAVVFAVIAASTLFGALLGLYARHRARFGSLYAMCPFIVIFLFLAVGTAVLAAIASRTAGRPDREWLAFFLGMLGTLPSLLIGMWLEARWFGWRLGGATQRWKRKIEPFVDYATRQVSPSLTENLSKRFKEYPSSTSGWCVSLVLNIPVFAEVFGGGRQNAVFYALPVIIGCFSYANIVAIGPIFMRIFFLRILEKEQGYRFANADYEQIQELRRHFRFARWLMKDYRPPQSLPDTEPEPAPFAPTVRSRTALKRISAQHDKTRRRK